MAPEEVVKTFYKWYIDLWSGPNRPEMNVEIYRQTGYLTEELVQQLEETMASFDRGGADPVICAQDVPLYVKVDQVSTQGDQATVVLGSSFEGHRLEIDLQQIEGVWKIAGITPESSATSTLSTRPEFADWRIYENSTYGIRMAYPPDWVYEEVTADPNAPPIGAEDVQMIVFFHPQEWDLNAPFNLELTEGSWEQYRASHLEPVRSEALEVNGYAATFELEQVTEEISIRRYLIENPTDKDWRVTFIDYISGFPDRSPGHEKDVELFLQMMQTFSFTR